MADNLVYVLAKFHARAFRFSFLHVLLRHLQRRRGDASEVSAKARASHYERMHCPTVLQISVKPYLHVQAPEFFFYRIQIQERLRGMFSFSLASAYHWF